MDATLIAASPSTKNSAGQRDPEMRSSKKGKQWYLGMKAHIGVDALSVNRRWIGTPYRHPKTYSTPKHNCHSACNIDPLSRGIGVQN